MFVTAIIVAGGRGQRLGADQPKQLLDLGGRSMLQHSVDAFDAHPSVREIIVVLPRDVQESVTIRTDAALRLATGGVRRQDSVASGLAAASPEAGIVLVHDAARPFVTGGVITRVIEAADTYGAALPARRASDTVKRAAPAGGQVIETIPRETIWLAQTPQGFRRDVLADAIGKNGGADATDEAMMAERAGYPVHLVEGDEDNLKITTLQDLESARARLRPGVSNRAEFRVGNGYDLHRLVEARALVLAGIEIPFEKGPLGHSDGDVICHALCDALFGAAAMGDIGRHFPNTDPAWKDAPGLDLLQRAAAIIREGGWRPSSVDCTVILEKPKLAPFVEPIRQQVAMSLGLDAGAVSIKAKTNEGVDAVGRGEAIAAHAVAVLRRADG